MWAHLQRQGIPVARCTVERIMRAQRLARGDPPRKVRTTEADPTATRAPDLVRRQFRASAARPAGGGRLHLRADDPGFGYTAFVVDAYAGLIAGWECSLTKPPPSSSARSARPPPPPSREGHPVGGHDPSLRAGSQYTSIHFTDTDPGRADPVGRHRRDALDNALAEPTIGLYKTECVRDGSPFRTAAAHPRRPRGDHLRLGALVQHQQAHAPARPTPTGRSRGRVLRSTTDRAAHRSHVTRCA